jgi:hypothetical protein
MAIVWISVGSRFLYTAADWASQAWYFEATMRQHTGTPLDPAVAHAKLYDLTVPEDVEDSSISTLSGTIVRVRSSTITLKDGHLYEARFGGEPADEGRALGAALIGIA